MGAKRRKIAATTAPATDQRVSEKPAPLPTPRAEECVDDEDDGERGHPTPMAGCICGACEFWRGELLVTRLRRTEPSLTPYADRFERRT